MYQMFLGIGNLAADCDSRFTQSGKQVVNFTVCCDSGYGDFKKTEYIRCVAWDKLAAICEQYLKKGSKCMVKGTMHTRKWQDKDGNDKFTTELAVRDMKMLSPKSEGANTAPQDNPPDDSVPF